MKLNRRHSRFLSRLVAGLFAVQIVLTGFCLMPGQAHAMPMMHAAMAMTDADGHCAAGMDRAAAGMDMLSHGKVHKASSHGGGCFHCADSGKFVQAAAHADVAPPSLPVAGIVALPEVPVAPAGSASADVAFATGPPGSFSLILTTTRRIRV